MSLNILIVCVILSFNFVASDVGDACRPTSDISEGQCVMVTDCEVALRHINENEGHPFKRCGFNGVMEIICCPTQPQPGVTTKLPNTTTTPRRTDPTTETTIPTTRPTTTTLQPPPPKRNDKLGDACRPSHNISYGECTFLIHCDIALRIFEKTYTHPFKRCGFVGEAEVICCPKKSINPEPEVISLLRDKVVAQTTTAASVPSKPKDESRIADKQCKKIVSANLPPFSLHIIGGANASQGEYPHMVALTYDTDDGIAFQCGGALISESFVLTAAHCVNVFRGKLSAARIGVTELGPTTFNPETDYKIDETFVHPNYSGRTKYHDIALLRLARRVVFSPDIVPACLHTGETVPNISLTITGWGRISNENHMLSPVLQHAQVAATPQDVCIESYGPWRQLPQGIMRGQFCAGDTVHFRDSCQGDSGGPVQAITEEDGFFRIIGITSFGRSCGGITPGVYTQVSVYLDWIESIVWPNEL